MKLTFQKDDLLNGINIVLKAVPSKTTMPILECILIDASDNQIKLTANDMELGIETKVEGSILSKGKIALDAKLLSEIIRKLSGGESDITMMISTIPPLPVTTLFSTFREKMAMSFPISHLLRRIISSVCLSSP